MDTGQQRVRRGVRAILVAASALGVLLVAAPHASAADPVTDAENALRKASLYVDPSATGFKIDRAKVEGEIPTGMKIAVLPTSAGSPSALAGQIGKSLDPNASGLTVAVLTADPSNYAFGAASSAFCAGYAGLRADAAEAANRTQLKATRGYHPVGVTTVLYALSAVGSGIWLLVLAAAALGLVTALQRRGGSGVAAAVITHLTWSVGMLVLLPPVFDLFP